MAAHNAPESEENSLTSSSLEKTITRGASRKTRQTKNPTSGPSTNKRTAEQAFHNAPTELVPDSQLENEVADLERQVLEAKKVVLQKQPQALTATTSATPTEIPVANPGEARKFEPRFIL